jgi:ATP-dependent RNA helicase RhlE
MALERAAFARMKFDEMGLPPSILRAIEDEGYETPTPIQIAAVPHVLAGRDLLGCAQTGTGKTAAFVWPILSRLDASRAKAPPKSKRPLRALVLAPTRELASQIGESVRAYGKHLDVRCVVLMGGVSQRKQEEALARGCDVLVACPGRLLDLMGQKLVSLETLEVFVLDEADRMLDMGFVHDVKRIARHVPKDRQTLLFSATMPPEIRALAGSLLRDPIEVAVTPIASTVEAVDQMVYFVEKDDKRKLLEWVLEDPRIKRAIVFSRTKHGANRIAKHLEQAGIPAAAIHGNKSQNAREKALAGLHDSSLRVLVATDIAARGIDVEGLDCVINADLPNVPETYVHRIGRTGRAGASGQAISFCAEDEREYLYDIEKLIGRCLPAVDDHPFPSPLGVAPTGKKKPLHAKVAPPKKPAGRPPRRQSAAR